MYGRGWPERCSFSRAFLPATRRKPRRAAAAAPTRPGSRHSSTRPWRRASHRATIAAAAPSLTYDQRIVNIDRGQRVFTQTFLEFSDRMAAAYRIQHGAALIKTNAQVFARIEQQYGVPAPVIVAFWALESDFGSNMGNYHSLAPSPRSPTTAGAADRFRAPTARRAAPDPARRPAPRGDDRLMGRRTRPDPDDAVGILPIRRRL